MGMYSRTIGRSIIPTWLISRVCPNRVLDSNHSMYGNWIQAEEVDHVSGNQREMTFENELPQIERL